MLLGHSYKSYFCFWSCLFQKTMQVGISYIIIDITATQTTNECHDCLECLNTTLVCCIQTCEDAEISKFSRSMSMDGESETEVRLAVALWWWASTATCSDWLNGYSHGVQARVIIIVFIMLLLIYVVCTSVSYACMFLDAVILLLASHSNCTHSFLSPPPSSLVLYFLLPKLISWLNYPTSAELYYSSHSSPLMWSTL